MSVSDVYAGLLEQLGFAGSARLRTVLAYLMTPDEARMVAALPGSPQEVADTTGMDINRVTDTLDALFYKGVVFPRGDFRRRVYYRFARSVVQLHDSTTGTREVDPKRDTEFCQMWQDFTWAEMCPYLAEGMGKASRPGTRIIPAHASIKDLPGVLPYENFQEMLKAQEYIAAVPCPCRYCAEGAGDHCDTHDEATDWACLQFGRGADYSISRGAGRELSIEEVLRLGDAVEQSGLLHTWENTSAIAGIKWSCQCCRDCCILAISVDKAGLPISKTWEKSRYQAFVNQEDCDGCQVCVDRCLFDAIDMVRPGGSKKYKAVVDPEKCFGCGVCVVGCDQAALKMKAVRPPEHIPAPAAPE